jgi:hypothetical protein
MPSLRCRWSRSRANDAGANCWLARWVGNRDRWEHVDAGLRHVSRPVATCGHDQLGPQLLPGLTAVVASVLLVASLWLSWPVLVLWSFVPLLVGAVGWFAVCARLVSVGLCW